MKYPEYYSASKDTLFQTTFGGYNKSPRASINDFLEQKNIGTEHYPLFGPRMSRRTHLFSEILKDKQIVGTTSISQGNEELLIVVTGDNKLMGIGIEYEELLFTEDLPAYAQGERIFAKMGADVVLFPDKIRIHINQDNSVSIEHLENTTVASGETFEGFGWAGYAAVDIATQIDGDEKIINAAYAKPQPESPEDGEYWLDSIRREDDYYNTNVGVLKKYSASSGKWVDVYPSYVKIRTKGIGKGFEKGDVVNIDFSDAGGSGPIISVQGEKVLEACGDDFIVVQGVISFNEVHEDGANWMAGMKVERKIPDCDFIVGCANRIWGCKYGYNEEGKLINEVYASALGDPTNWLKAEGIASDSYTVTIGEPGKFTGAIVYNDVPHFFKERGVVKVYGTAPSNYETVFISLDGVEPGSHKSLVVVEGELLYKAKRGIMSYTGNYSSLISDEFGGQTLTNGVAGEFDGKYYVCLMDTRGIYYGYVYNPQMRIWAKEDIALISDYVRTTDRLLAIIPYENTIYSVADTDAHESFDWLAESRIIGLDSPDTKYVSRMRIRADIPLGSYLEVALEYNGEGDFVVLDRFSECGFHTSLSVPMPRRCDTFRYRLRGKGDVRIYSIAYDYEGGSDI